MTPEYSHCFGKIPHASYPHISLRPWDCFTFFLSLSSLISFRAAFPAYFKYALAPSLSEVYECPDFEIFSATLVNLEIIVQQSTATLLSCVILASIGMKPQILEWNSQILSEENLID